MSSRLRATPRHLPSIIALTLAAVAGCHTTPPTARIDGPPEEVPPSRTFQIRYVAHAEALPIGGHLRLWLPVPHDDPHQRVRDLHISPVGASQVDGAQQSFTVERAHDNLAWYLEGTVRQPEIEVQVSYTVDRWPYRIDPEGLAPEGRDPGVDSNGKLERYLQPSSLCVITDEIRETAARLRGDETNTVAIARTFYDHVANEMTYDKSGTGWGRGSTVYACSVGRGNCTDFHSYFISLCRAAGIPARFQIGLYGSYEHREEEYETGGYHCWAEFHVPDRGWVPVDISEADKHPEMYELFFGGHTDNRVTLSTGRDILLEPRQMGAPLNYFLAPYAEVDGKPVPFEKRSSWRDL